MARAHAVGVAVNRRPAIATRPVSRDGRRRVARLACEGRVRGCRTDAPRRGCTNDVTVNVVAEWQVVHDVPSSASCGIRVTARARVLETAEVRDALAAGTPVSGRSCDTRRTSDRRAPRSARRTSSPRGRTCHPRSSSPCGRRRSPRVNSPLCGSTWHVAQVEDAATSS